MEAPYHISTFLRTTSGSSEGLMQRCVWLMQRRRLVEDLVEKETQFWKVRMRGEETRETARPEAPLRRSNDWLLSEWIVY